MSRPARIFLLSAIVLAVVPATAGAATVTATLTSITFDAAPGETNTAVIADEGGGVYFVGDENPNVTVADPGLPCLSTPAGLGLPKGYLCTVPGATTLVENLGDGNDTGVINATGTTTGTINGGDGSDLLVGGTEDDTFNGGDGDDTVVYAGVSAAGITRTAGITATLPQAPATSTDNNGQTGENDTISNDIEGIIGGNGDDTITGNDGDNTLAGAAPPGIAGITSSPAGNDTIDGMGGDDTILAGDSGSINGGPGNDNLIGGRSTAATTVIHGGDGNDTIVSGLGNDDIFGDAGSNTLAYASVIQSGLTVVDRGTNGVTASLPSPGTTGTGGTTGGAEHDTIHDDIRTLVGSNGSDDLSGGDSDDTLVGVAPAGTPGVAPGPAGNDTLSGGGGADVLLGAEGNDTLTGGPGADVFLAGAGDDKIFSRDQVVESPICGDGIDTVVADPDDTPAADCENVDTKLHETVKPRLTLNPALLHLRGRHISFRLRCANEPDGCHGRIVIRSRQKLPSGKTKRQKTLGSFKFHIRNNKSQKFNVKLKAQTLKVVKRHHSLKLIGIATTKDTSGNQATRNLKLRLKRR